MQTFVRFPHSRDLLVINFLFIGLAVLLLFLQCLNVYLGYHYFRAVVSVSTVKSNQILFGKRTRRLIIALSVITAHLFCFVTVYFWN